MRWFKLFAPSAGHPELRWLQLCNSVPNKDCTWSTTVDSVSATPEARAEEARMDVDLPFMFQGHPPRPRLMLVPFQTERKHVDNAHKFIDYMIKPVIPQCSRLHSLSDSHDPA